MNGEALFDLNKTIAKRLFLGAEYPWDALDMLEDYIRRVGRGLDRAEFFERERGIWISYSASVSGSAILKAPLIIGKDSRIGSNAVVGGSVIVGEGATIGDNSEVRRSVIFDGARIEGRNYIGESLIGGNAIFGVGAIISNMRADRGEVVCSLDGESVGCGRKRFGALVGDGAEVGCSSVIGAGSVLERGARVTPLTRVRGLVSSQKGEKGERIIADIL